MSQRSLNERDSDIYHVTIRHASDPGRAANSEEFNVVKFQRSTSVTILGPSSIKGTS